MIRLLCFYLILCGSVAMADNYASGSSLDGYTKSGDGYWWRNGAAYSLSQSRVYRGYGSCSYYTRNHFSPVAVIVKEKVIEKPVYQDRIVEKISYKDPDWREQVLQIAKDRDEQRAFLEVLKVLGYQQQPETPVNYSVPNSFRYGITSSEYAYAPKSGNTVYGYGVNDLARIYQANDVDVWMQQASRAQLAAQETAEKGLGGILSAIELEGESRSKVATILATAKLLESLDTERRVTNTRIDVAGSGDYQLPGAGLLQGNSLGSLMAQKCYHCHSPQGTNGILGRQSALFPNRVDLTQYGQFTAQQKQAVLNAVISGSMPQDGTLTSAEKALFSADFLSQ